MNRLFDEWADWGTLMEHLASWWPMFFFQAEDVIRDRTVTGVQTCALPIFHFGRRRHRTPRLGALPARVHAVDPITFQPLAPAIEDGPRDPQLAAHRADVALHLRALDDAQAHPVYALVEGHRSVLPQWFPWSGCHSGKDRADGLLLRSREVSTLLRVRII